MAGAMVLLRVILVSVFLHVIFIIPYASAIKKPGSDSTLPSGSLKPEEPNSIQVEGLGGNQTTGEKPHLDPLKLNDDDKFKVKVTFDTIEFSKINYDPSNGDPNFVYDGQEYNVAAYVQGKKIDLVDPPHIGPGATLPLTNKQVSIETIGTAPLSIMTIGYEADADKCLLPYLPADIQKRVLGGFVAHPGLNPFNLFSKYPHLKTIQTELKNSINSRCNEGQGHSVFQSINNVYQPTTYGASSHTDSSFAAFKLKYHIDVTAPVNTVKK
jgi:hypothetical protein